MPKTKKIRRLLSPKTRAAALKVLDPFMTGRDARPSDLIRTTLANSEKIKTLP
jgi:hypothetical protein